MKGFSYGYTCPHIDDNIRDAKGILESYVEALYRELNPTIDVFCNLPNEIQSKIDEDVKNLYEELECVFEDVRSINEDMRNEADTQVREALSEVEDLKYEVTSLEEELAKL